MDAEYENMSKEEFRNKYTEVVNNTTSAMVSEGWEYQHDTMEGFMLFEKKRNEVEVWELAYRPWPWRKDKPPHVEVSIINDSIDDYTRIKGGNAPTPHDALSFAEIIMKNYQ